MATRRIPWLNKMNNEGKEVVPGQVTPPKAPMPAPQQAPRTMTAKPAPVLAPSTPPAPDRTYTAMGDTEKAQLAEAKQKQQRSQGLADTLAQQQGRQRLLERQGPQQSPVTSRTTQPPPATTNSVQDAALAALQEILGQGVRDTSAEQAQASAVSEAAIGKALADQRARQGFAGFGLSGASAAQDADVRRVGARDLTSTQQAIDAQARNEYLQRVQLASGAASEFQGNEIERQAWELARQQIEKELTGQTSPKTPDELRSVGAAYAGQPLNRTKKKDLESQGLVFHLGNKDDMFKTPVYVDQFGNESEIPSTDADSKPSDEGLGD